MFTYSRHGAHPQVSGTSRLSATVGSMNPLASVFRPLGNHGALTNARIALEHRAREDWLVQSLAGRLDRLAPPALMAPTAEDSAVA